MTTYDIGERIYVEDDVLEREYVVCRGRHRVGEIIPIEDDDMMLERKYEERMTTYRVGERIPIRG